MTDDETPEAIFARIQRRRPGIAGQGDGTPAAEPAGARAMDPAVDPDIAPPPGTASSRPGWPPPRDAARRAAAAAAADAIPKPGRMRPASSHADDDARDNSDRPLGEEAAPLRLHELLDLDREPGQPAGGRDDPPDTFPRSATLRFVMRHPGWSLAVGVPAIALAARSVATRRLVQSTLRLAAQPLVWQVARASFDAARSLGALSGPDARPAARPRPAASTPTPGPSAAPATASPAVRPGSDSDSGIGSGTRSGTGSRTGSRTP